jgi:hypothetical protein
METFTLRRSAIAALVALTAILGLCLSGPASAATDPAVISYLDDRVQFVTTPGQGGCARSLNLAANSINGGRVVGYVGSAPGIGVVQLNYSPAGSGGGVFFPARFATGRVKMMFSDAAHFSPAAAHEVTIRIIMWPSGPMVSVTLHTWGGAEVTFPLKGANNSVIYGDDNADSHMALTIGKVDCTTPR